MSQILNNIYYNTSFALKLNSQAMAKLQEQASTGSRVNRPSDDPSRAFRILGLDSQKRRMQGSIDAISNCTSLLEVSSTVINQMSKTMADTKTLLAGVTDTDGSIGQTVYAESLDNYLEELVALANKKHNGQYLFGGTNTTSKPFEVVRKDGKIIDVNYKGSRRAREMKISDSINVSAFYAGSDLFSLDKRDDVEFLGETGVKQGKGTSTVKGFAWLDVKEVSPDVFRFSIDGFKTYTQMPVPPGIDNLKLTNSETGEVLYVDSRSVTKEGTDLVEAGGTHDLFDTLDRKSVV